MQKNINLNEEQYQSLCEACDSILTAQDSTIERIAISWLHVIREHPVFMAHYIDLFQPNNGIIANVRKWWRVFRRRAGWVRQLLMSIQVGTRPWFGPDNLHGNIDVLFISHLLNPSHAGRDDDFYFGSLPNKITAQGYSAVIALINHSGQPAARFADKWDSRVVQRVVLSDALSFLEEVSLYWRLKMESFRLRKLAKKEGQGLKRRVFIRASEETLSGKSLSTLRMATQIASLAVKVQPKVIVVMHEGHAWERVSLAAVRSAVPEVRCIGYQHAALFRLQHAIRRNLSREYNPDHIFTAGTISKTQLDRAPRLNGIPVSVLGSNRNLKNQAINQSGLIYPRAARADYPACLVIPEGYLTEYKILFTFALVCAGIAPQINFIFRVHPILSFDSIKKQDKKFQDLPKNIRLSNVSLEDDFARCRWALYRGSTAAVQATLFGLRPIYLELPGELTIDPLYELKDWRSVIKTPEEFLQVIKIYPYDKHKDLQEAYQKAHDYCARFYCSLNDAAFVKELAMFARKKGEHS
ncbi:MAG: hypothetical protein ABIH18_03325 [Candidatus Omnitrophota bacterium]